MNNEQARRRLDALIKLQEGKIAVITENINTYLFNQVGIGEHRGVMEELDALFAELATAQDTLNCLRKFDIPTFKLEGEIC